MKHNWRYYLDPRDPDFEEAPEPEDQEPEDDYLDGEEADYCMTEPELRGDL